MSRFRSDVFSRSSIRSVDLLRAKMNPPRCAEFSIRPSVGFLLHSVSLIEPTLPFQQASLRNDEEKQRGDVKYVARPDAVAFGYQAQGGRNRGAKPTAASL